MTLRTEALPLVAVAVAAVMGTTSAFCVGAGHSSSLGVSQWSHSSHRVRAAAPRTHGISSKRRSMSGGKRRRTPLHMQFEGMRKIYDPTDASEDPNPNYEEDVSADQQQQGKVADIPSDPRAIFELEKEYYEMEKAAREGKRLDALRESIGTVPRERQCYKYSWTQDNDRFKVKVPLFQRCENKELYLALSEDNLQIGVKTDPDFAQVVGSFPGKVLVESSSFQVERDLETNRWFITLEIVKKPQEGTMELWYCLFQGEQERKTICFQGETEDGPWKQTPDEIELKFAVPGGTRGKGVHLAVDDSGEKMTLSVDGYPSLGTFDRYFYGPVVPGETVWMLDDNADGSKDLTITLKKKRIRRGRAAWWAGPFSEQKEGRKEGELDGYETLKF